MEAAAVLELRPASAGGVAPMADEELKRRYTEIKLTRNDYRFGELFAEAETRSRTQEDVAKVIGITRQRVQQLWEFGRFCRHILENATTVANSETARSTLLRTPERLFRKFWTETKDIGNTVQRYRAIYARLKDLPVQDTHEMNRFLKLADDIKELGLANGKRIRVEELLKRVDVQPDFLVAFLDGVREHPRHGLSVEWMDRKKAVRIHQTSKVRIDPRKFLSQIDEYLEELVSMRKLHPARLSPNRISELAVLIRRVVEAAMQ